DRVDPALLGAVLDEHQHQLAADRRDPGVHGEHVEAEPVPLDLEVDLTDLAVPAYLPDQIHQLVPGQPVATDQAERAGGRAGLQHFVVGADHHGRGTQHRQHPRYVRGYD